MATNKIVYHQTQNLLRVLYGDRVADTNPDGLLAIVTPIGTIEECVARIPAGALNVRVVKDSDLPTDRTDRNNWQLINGKIEVSAVVKE